MNNALKQESNCDKVKIENKMINLNLRYMEGRKS